MSKNSIVIIDDVLHKDVNKAIQEFYINNTKYIIIQLHQNLYNIQIRKLFSQEKKKFL